MPRGDWVIYYISNFGANKSLSGILTVIILHFIAFNTLKQCHFVNTSSSMSVNECKQTVLLLKRFLSCGMPFVPNINKYKQAVNRF